MNKIKEINLQEFCEQVSVRCGAEARIVPEQVLEAIGGITNLYFEVLLARAVSASEFTISEAFASESVSVEEILQEIRNCAGTSKSRSKLIFQAMQEVLRHCFKQHGVIASGERMLFRPLGEFDVVDVDTSNYLMTFRDPSAPYYEKFLYLESMKHDREPEETPPTRPIFVPGP